MIPFRYIRLLSIFILAILCWGCPITDEADDSYSEAPEFWIWAGAKTRSIQEWDSIFHRLDTMGIKGILAAADTHLLNMIIPIAQQHDIEVHAWFWAMNRRDADTSWLSVNHNGVSLSQEKAYVDYYKFMCPALPEVKEFLQKKIGELAKIKGLAGIHLDYIRYVDVILPIALQPKYGLLQDHIMPEYDYGYHPKMRSLFKEKYGIDPLNLKDPAHDTLWLNFRLNELDKTLAGLRDQIRGAGLFASAAVFPSPELAKTMVRQDWSSWDLDYFFPMVYHNFYDESADWIREITMGNKSIIPPSSKVICGLYLPGMKSKAELESAMDAAMEGGADGVAFFSLNGLDNESAEFISSYINKASEY